MKHTRFFLVLALALTAFAAKVTYSYDANGRLASATYSGGLVIAYTYDPAGNLLNRTVGTVAAGAATITSVNTAGAAWFRAKVETEIGPLLDEYWYDAPETSKKARTKLLADLA